jgi:hypothetical protein
MPEILPNAHPTTLPDGNFPEGTRYERPDNGQATPFKQTSSQPGEGAHVSISPHRLFGFFTSDIILENKVFVR